MIEPVCPHGRCILIDCEQRPESGSPETLREPTRAGKQIDDRREAGSRGVGRFTRTERGAELPQLTSLAERSWTPADGASVRHQVHVKRVPKVRRDHVGKYGLELLVVES